MLFLSDLPRTAANWRIFALKEHRANLHLAKWGFGRKPISEEISGTVHNEIKWTNGFNPDKIVLLIQQLYDTDLVARFLDFSTEDDALDALVLGVRVVDICNNNNITKKAGAIVVTY